MVMLLLIHSVPDLDQTSTPIPFLIQAKDLEVAKAKDLEVYVEDLANLVVVVAKDLEVAKDVEDPARLAVGVEVVTMVMVSPSMVVANSHSTVDNSLYKIPPCSNAVLSTQDH